MHTISYYSLKECADGINKVELVNPQALNGSYFVTPGIVKHAIEKTDPFVYSQKLDERLTIIEEALNCLNFEKSILDALKDELLERNVADITEQN